jgi:CheY-like chemotaxis protein
VGTITIETSTIALDEAYCREHDFQNPGEYVGLAFSDTGAGMDTETLERIFEPFFTTKEVGKGTGLGLSTVYGIVKQDGGTINAYSEPGIGTTFRIYFPRVREAAEEGVEPVREAAPVGTETVLLVEDEEQILSLVARILEGHGYRVLSTRSPEEACRLAERHDGKIDLLLTDVVMPGMNGKELQGRIGGLRPGIPTLFMSGYTANAIAHRGVLDEGVAFVQKPFTVRSLAEKVRSVLDS